MRTYLICFDITAPKRHALAGAVMELGEAWARPLDATWYVQSAERADDIERRLRPFADAAVQLVGHPDQIVDRRRIGQATRRDVPARRHVRTTRPAGR